MVWDCLLLTYFIYSSQDMYNSIMYSMFIIIYIILNYIMNRVYEVAFISSKVFWTLMQSWACDVSRLCMWCITTLYGMHHDSVWDASRLCVMHHDCVWCVTTLYGMHHDCKWCITTLYVMHHNSVWDASVYVVHHDSVWDASRLCMWRIMTLM